MKTVVSLVGPTATGKTSLSLSLSKKLFESGVFNKIDLISADSRQVYKGLAILTGADVPPNFSQQPKENYQYPYFVSGKISLHGISIIDPDKEWSLAHFREMAHEIISSSYRDGSLPILVGGTGMFHRHALSTDERISVGPSRDVRKKAATMPLQELQSWAEEVNPERFSNLNNSDRNNPRRLVRTIEFGLAQKTGDLTNGTLDSGIIGTKELQETNHLFIGLTHKEEELEEKITKRVASRMKNGALGEVERVFNQYRDSSIGLNKKKIPAFSSLGFSELLAYSQGEVEKEECINTWVRRELSYARRQMTWFKKNAEIAWFAADDDNLEEKVYLLLEKSL